MLRCKTIVPGLSNIKYSNLICLANGCVRDVVFTIYTTTVMATHKRLVAFYLNLQGYCLTPGALHSISYLFSSFNRIAIYLDVTVVFFHNADVCVCKNKRYRWADLPLIRILRQSLAEKQKHVFHITYCYQYRILLHDEMID